MHGIIFTELRKYVDEKLGGNAWSDLLNAAGLRGRMYLPIQEYPDAEAVTLVVTASEITGLDAGVILEDFGKFIAPSLLGMYRTLVQPEWRTLDVLEFTENTIHKVVRSANPGAKPPELKAVRISPTELHLTYGSQRKLCFVAKGIIQGLATHFDEEITLEETQCMHAGADSCEFVVHVSTGLELSSDENAPDQKAKSATATTTAKARKTAQTAKPAKASKERKPASKSTKPRKTAAAAKTKKAPAAKAPVANKVRKASKATKPAKSSKPRTSRKRETVGAA